MAILPFVNVHVLYNDEDSKWDVVVDDAEKSEKFVHNSYNEKVDATKDARDYAKTRDKSQLVVRSKRNNVVEAQTYD